VACPFCDVASADLVYESGLVIAIRDRFPVSPGHTLVITRRHVATYFEASREERAELWRAVDLLREKLAAQNPCADGFNVGFNAGPAAGQTVMHVHVHLIPRFSGDMNDPSGGVRGVIPAKQKYDATSSFDTARTLAALPGFVSGEEQHFVKALRQALALAESADLLAAFVQQSGIQLLKTDLEEAARRGVHIRLLTGDYLGVTSADALRMLVELDTRFDSIETALYETTSDSPSFHPKSYIFRRGKEEVAYVGSSNLSQTALQQGVEWNLRLLGSQDPDTVRAIADRFQRLWADPKTKRLTPELIRQYELRAPVPDPERPEPRQARPTPHPIQDEALERLQATRKEGHDRGLVVLATGLGKTYLAAFDFGALGGQRALFVAHREEILDQARAAWAQVFPDKTIGTLGSGRFENDVDLLFASVQTLARERHLSGFDPKHFDYVVVDEFHHASARTYRAVMTHFQPRFMLGLTATPDRLDGASLLELCDDNLVFRQDLLHGIVRKLLVPFHYFGVKDAIDFEPIPWRNGRFDPNSLDNAVTAAARDEQVFREYKRHAPPSPRRTLGFCSSTRHADHIANYFNANGVPAAAVHVGPTSAPRSESLEKLRGGQLEVIFAVDIFNEGLDVPEINTVLMLRPTVSPVVFLQQLGRGLRRAEGKPHLTVVDFIGNHRSFLQRPQGLAYLTGEAMPPLVALQRIRDHALILPEGCSVDIETEAIDMLASLARVSRDDMLLFEYATFRDANGRRPTASELFGRSVHFKPIRERFGDWFDFVDQQHDLSEDESRVWSQHKRWFADLLRTPMSKSYKMLAVEALLEHDAFFEGMEVARNTEAALDIARRTLPFYKELKEDEDRSQYTEHAVRKWRSMPLNIWARGEGTSRAWFSLEDDVFRPSFEVKEEDRSIFEDLTAELVTLRLKEHLDRLRGKAQLDADTLPIVLKVSHSNNRPILRFDRDRRRDIPENDIDVIVDGRPYTFQFRKIACNVALDRVGGSNVLPALLRGWLGPTAGLPGTRHSVELVRRDDHWVLQHATRDDVVFDVPTSPKLPYFPELKVACGAIHQTDRLSEVTTRLQVAADREVEAGRHFLVRATGDSMNGGDHPIQDGDLVLCEWWLGGAANEIQGKPMLVVGHVDSENSFAAIKVPLNRDGTWVLHSWNPNEPDQSLPAGGRVEPVARVLGVVQEATGLTLYAKYGREDIAKAFGDKVNQSWQVGHRDITVNGKPNTILMVDLRKDVSTKLEYRYADLFLSKEDFQWESQAQTTPEDAKGRRILGHAKEGRLVHLFARYQKRGDDFVYCGTINYVRHEGKKPLRVWWKLAHPLPDSLWKAWAP
jgi:superfamily II DNA or RNA helicase/diadenosine tetraphosphate (Ap4A) HIT family hydrolase